METSFVEHSYEQSVRALHADPGMRAYMEKNYLDPDLADAVARYAASPEFSAICALIEPRMHAGFRMLDLGVGRGLTSLAFASKAIPVTCMEYEASEVTGIGALSKYLPRNQQLVRPLRADAERLPFSSGSFDIVFCRSVLHHLNDLDQGLREMQRVLKSGGLFLAWNEHILTVFSTGKKFLEAHPAVRYGVNENAYAIPTYWWKVRRSGLARIRFCGHYLNRDEFLRAARDNPLRAAAMEIPVAGRLLSALLHCVHIVRRTLVVQEEALPVSCILAEKP